MTKPSHNELHKMAMADPVLWNFRYMRNEKGEKFDFQKHKYQEGILEDLSPEIIIVKGSQVGMTTMTTGKILYMMDCNPMTWIYCVDDKTELLSRRGWLKWNQIRENDHILTINKETMCSRWSLIEELFTQNVTDFNMKKMGNSRFSSLTTPNHRWLVKDKDESYFVESQNIFEAKNRKIPTAVEFSGGRKKAIYDNDFVALVGWILTEGHFPPSESVKNKSNGTKLSRVGISQSTKVNKDKCDRITKIIDNLGIDYYITPVNGNGCVNFIMKGEIPYRIRQMFPKKELTAKFVNSLTQEQLHILIETMIDGDGWRREIKYVKGFIQKSKKTTDNFAMACILAGYSISIRRRKHAKDKCYTVLLLKSKDIYVEGMKVEDENYNGVVWCPRTKDGTFLARREGSVYWTGNTFPSANDVNKFSAARFAPMVRRSPYLKTRVGGLDNVAIKTIGDSTVYFGGTFTEGQAISIPADAIVHDELNFSKPDVMETYSSRLSHSSWKITWMFSTPTLPEYGISAEWDKSDQRVWMIKCVWCNTWQTCEYFVNVRKRKGMSGPNKYFWGCIKCGRELRRFNGEWVRSFKRRVHGYHIPPSICEWITPLYLRRLEKRLRPQVFYNYHLGLPYSGGTAVLTRDILLECTNPSRVPETGEGYFMGVDQGDILHVEISRFNGGVREICYYETTDNFERLDQLMNIYRVRCCVIDAMPNKHSARAFRDRFPGRVYMTYYRDIPLKEQTEYKDADEPGVLLIDRSSALDSAATHWITHSSAIIPPDQQLIKQKTWDEPRYNTGWLQQMCNMKREVNENDRGESRVVWIKTGADHFRHADVYNYIAYKKFANVGLGKALVGGNGSLSLGKDFNSFSSGAKPSMVGPSKDSGILVGGNNYDFNFEEYGEW